LYRKIKPILLEHRVAVEAELRKTGKGIWPAPYLVMDRLLGLPSAYERPV